MPGCRSLAGDALFGVQGWRWDWVRKVRALVCALDAEPVGQQQWRQLAHQAALCGKQVAVCRQPPMVGTKTLTRHGSPGPWRGLAPRLPTCPREPTYVPHWKE